MNRALREIISYECTNCNTLVEEAVISIHYELKVPIDDVVDGHVQAEDFTELAMETYIVECPHCGADIS